jgi:hypothetical protein
MSRTEEGRMAENGAQVEAGAGRTGSFVEMSVVEDRVRGRALERTCRSEVNKAFGSPRGGLMAARTEHGAAGSEHRHHPHEHRVPLRRAVHPVRAVSGVLRRGRGSLLVPTDVIDVGDRELVASATLDDALFDQR